MNQDSHRTLQSFENALNKLVLFLSTPIAEERDKAGIIQAFEYSFELCWKAIQKLCVAHNKTVGSPKQAFQAAFELGWIREKDQDAWIRMADDRNLTTHTYKESLADEVLLRIRNQHVMELKKLIGVLKKN